MGTAVPQHLLPWGVEQVEQPAPAKSVMAMDEQGQNPEGQPAETEKNKPAQQDAALNPKENFPLLNTACAALRTIQKRDFKGLAAYVDGEQGLTFTSFSTVDREVDLTFTADQVAMFGQKADKYNWGVNPETHEALNMTPEQYFSAYMYGVDYTQASQIGVDKINIVGNALENVTEAYPGCRFVEFTFPGLGSGTQRQEWSSLKLVFTPNQNSWKLVGLIHSQWTV